MKNHEQWLEAIEGIHLYYPGNDIFTPEIFDGFEEAKKEAFRAYKKGNLIPCLQSAIELFEESIFSDPETARTFLRCIIAYIFFAELKGIPEKEIFTLLQENQPQNPSH